MNDLRAIFAGMLLNTGPESVCVSGPLSNPRMGKARKTKVLGWQPSAPHQTALLTLNSLPNVNFPSPSLLLFSAQNTLISIFTGEARIHLSDVPFFHEVFFGAFQGTDRSLLQISLLLAGLLRTSLIAFCIAFCLLLSAFPALQPHRL